MAAFVGYCDKDDVIGHVTIFTDKLSATSKPPESRVEEWISSAGIEINQALDALGYETPVEETDSPNAYAWLRDLNALEPAGKLEMSLSSAASPPNSRGREQDLMSQWNRKMKLLRDGDIKLSDAVTKADVQLHDADESPGSHLEDTSLALTDDDVEPQFDTDFTGAMGY